MTARRERFREITKDEIKVIARQQMAAEGTAALSLRAIAREMEMTAPALYRYFPSRDDLITALILDAFNAHADAMAAGAAAYPKEDYSGRLWGALKAYRDWALQNPVDFQLIYGNPIPGYDAPAEKTIAAASRAFVVVVGILAEALAAGVLKPSTDYDVLPPAVLQRLEQINSRDGYNVPPAALAITARGWAQMHGIVMLEIFGHLPPVVGDVDSFFRFEMGGLFRSMGLTPPL